MAVATLKKTERWDENKGTNVVIVDMFFKIIREIIKVESCGMIIQIISRHIMNFEKNIKKMWQLFQDN